MNPLVENLQTISRVTEGLVYQTLLQCPEGNYQPGLAENWEISNDGHRILLRLRSGVRFHDDRPFSGLDVQASLEMARRASPKSSTFHVLLADVEGIDILPEHEVRIRLLRPSDLTLRALCEIPILPADPLRNGGASLAQLGRSPQGTGPYRLHTWDRGKRIKLIRSKRGEGEGGALLDEITFEIETDLAKALLRTRRGEIDVLPRLLDAHFPDQVTPATLRDTLAVYRIQSERYSYVLLNQKRGALSNPRFREGLSLLWDRARFSEELHHGLTTPIGAPPFGSVKPDPFDPKRAAKIFEMAGFQDTDGDGVREIGGEAIRFTFILPSSAKSLAMEVRAFALELRKAGVLLDTMTVQEPSAIVSRIESGEFDMAAMQWEGRRDEDPRLLIGPAGDFQFTGYRSEAFLNRVEAIKAAASPQGRRTLLKELADLLAADRPVIFLYSHATISLISTKVHGIWTEGDSLNLRSAWLSP